VIDYDYRLAVLSELLHDIIEWMHDTSEWLHDAPE
jgi:hypothetical protein